jgi:hypothetical protein
MSGTPELSQDVTVQIAEGELGDLSYRLWCMTAARKWIAATPRPEDYEIRGLPDDSYGDGTPGGELLALLSVKSQFIVLTVTNRGFLQGGPCKVAARDLKSGEGELFDDA